MIRFLFHGIPLALVALIVAAFVNISLLAKNKKNELSIGMLGEPATLNPIQEADAAGGEVQSAIFNGLLKYDENLEVTTDLAESFVLSQQTTIPFTDGAQVQSALARLLFAKPRWAGWKLTDARQENSNLVLTLSEPGMQASQEIFDFLQQGNTQPLHTIRIDAAEGQIKPVREAIAALPANSLILREWFESEQAVELTVRGSAEDFLAAVQPTLDAKPDWKAKMQTLGTSSFLAEPIVDFVLRPNVRWHDGAPFTSRDVAFTYSAIMDDRNVSPRKSDFSYVLRVETPDEHRVRVVYRKPYSPALLNWMMSVLPAHILADKSSEWWAKNFNRRPIGTGPYKFDSWKTNEYVRVVRNPDYFNAPGPWLDSIVYRVLPDMLTLRLAFETRQVDYWSVDPWAVKSFENDDRFQLFSSSGMGYEYVAWNLRRPLFQDERVRRALAHAVNIPEMIKYILYGRGTQSTGIFTPEMWFFDPNVQPYIYDPEKAKALLAEAGWKPGPDGILTKDGQRFTFTLLGTNANEIRRDIATLVQDNLRAIGIEAKIELYEWAVYLKNFILKGNFDATVLGWRLGPDYDQYTIWHSSQNNPEQLNVISYNNPKVDGLLTEIREEYNREKIISLAGDLQSTIYRDQPYLFLYVPKSTSVIWNDSLRIRRPDGHGGWIDTPVEVTKAGWRYYMDWFYRPEYQDQLPK